MGLPDIQWEIERFPHRIALLTCSLLAIIFAYIVGIVGFIYVPPRCTYTPDSMFWTAQ
jgi:hypothetical protein